MADRAAEGDAMTEGVDWNFARTADASSGNNRNEHTIALIERMVDEGKPFPRSLNATSTYLYADDYYRRKMGANRSASVLRVSMYLDEDRYPEDRILPYTCEPLLRTGDGYICTCATEPKKTAKPRLGTDLDSHRQLGYSTYQLPRFINTGDTCYPSGYVRVVPVQKKAAALVG